MPGSRLVMVIAMLLRNFDIKKDDPGYKLKVKHLLIIKPAGFKVRVSLRDDERPTEFLKSLRASSMMPKRLQGVTTRYARITVDRPTWAKQAPKSLEQELGDQEIKDDSDSKDDTKELKQQLNKTNKDFKEMRDIFNQNATALKELQEQARKT
ncbi:hypothetical protein COL922a_013355 [Colletotrichum nupharicola]|nr:hypothetical protein COL922a_013355 [Colletotrichum nupharicola]